ncbi:MAG: c-type cytochrome [Phycisphaerae bacterium]|jgi:YVTN family beta-propeller protein|nr:c-type cytochrome [Phycisphaerae bacterium]
MGKISLTASLVILATIVVGCESEEAPATRRRLNDNTNAQRAPYRSPLSAAVSPDGKTLYVSDRTAGCVTLLDAVSGGKIRDIRIAGEPNGLVLSGDGKTLYVAQRKTGSIALIDTAAATVDKHISVGPWPVAVALAEKSKRLYSCNRGDHTVSVIDLVRGKEIGRIAVVRDPAGAAVSADESRIVVANFMPAQAGTDPNSASEISILDAKSMRQTARVKLPAGSTMARGIYISPDGKWAYATHLLGRFDLPVTQLEQGWVHTTALSIIDLVKSTRLATVLLDDLTKGAPDPWAVVGSKDGKKLWISHRGVHEVSMLDIGRIHKLLAGEIPPDLAGVKDGQRDNIWVRISKDKRQIAELSRDLTAMHISNTLARTPSGGKGPTGLALGPDGKRLYTANYYGASLGVLDAVTGKLLSTISLGDQPKPDAARRGEIFFHDATRCYQRWHSCASCHLDGGRIDALPWDFLRDGIDNGKDVISLVYMQHTPPHNRLATRPNPWECMETGIVGSHHMEPAKPEVDDLLAYVKSLRPEPNPNLHKFAAAAKRGKTLFEGKGKCAGCHRPPWFTDNKSYNVGISSANEPDSKYDTPSLIEAYRTAPYYHDGRAATMKDALTKHDPKGLHGRLKDLTPREIEDLIAYVLSL